MSIISRGLTTNTLIARGYTIKSVIIDLFTNAVRFSVLIKRKLRFRVEL